YWRWHRDRLAVLKYRFKEPPESDEILTALCDEIRAKPWFPKMDAFGFFGNPFSTKAARQALAQGWREDRSYDPVTEYSWLTCPTLVMFGKNDKCNDPTICEKNIRAGFSKSANKRLTIIVYPGVGHDFQGSNIGEDIPKWLAKLKLGDDPATRNP